jgi:hypothetical protein
MLPVVLEEEGDSGKAGTTASNRIVLTMLQSKSQQQTPARPNSPYNEQ